MHYAAVLGREGNARFLFDGQGVDVGAQKHRLALSGAAAQEADDPCAAGHALCDLDAVELSELFGDAGGCAGLFK